MSEVGLRVLGIYDRQIFELCENLGILQFGHDFRPKSLNFFQGYRFISMLNAANDPRYRYGLHYADEMDFAIQKMLFDIERETDVQRKQLHLLFSDDRGRSYYGQFGLPFAWYFKSLKSFKALIGDPLLTEVILDYSEIEFLHGQGKAVSVLKEIRQICSDRTDFHISLTVPWVPNLLSSLFDFFHFDLYLPSISPYVEKSYRLIDGAKLAQNIDSLRSLLPGARGIEFY
ncbi:MAG: hypothetical protein OXB88_06260 [Bacteriovoracales bacterium]|nr:hypothetical protein [Bacteriovoracales bacterium]